MVTAALAGPDVHAVVEPAPFVGCVEGEEAQGIFDAVASLVGFYPVPPRADAQGRQAKTGRRDAADVAALLLVPAAGGSVSGEAGVRVRLLPAETEGGLGKNVQR